MKADNKNQMKNKDMHLADAGMQVTDNDMHLADAGMLVADKDHARKSEKGSSLTRGDFRQALINTIPVLSGYMVLGIGFGVILKSKGYGILWALACSVFIYAGSMQYVLINLITGGAGLLTTALTTLMVNARHIFYGISMIDRYKKAGREKPYLIFALTDETYSLVCNEALPEDPVARRKQFRFWALESFMNQCYWVTGSVIGSACGALLGDKAAGMDYAMTALFIMVFTEQWIENKDHFPALTGVIVSVICLILFGSGQFLIPTMILITCVLTGRMFWQKKKEEKS